MKVYTRTGDDGETSLLSGGRVKKNNHRVEAYGTVDELSSMVGLLRCESIPGDVAQHLVDVQRSLFAVGAFLADPEGRVEHEPESWEVGRLENWIDAMCAELPELRAFILPGGCRGAALAHVVRAVCRRAERRVAILSAAEVETPEGVLRYLNRLSDALFTLARFLNARSENPETEWHPISEHS
jgi:cob(I)alamin adenosyltransferase